MSPGFHDGAVVNFQIIELDSDAPVISFNRGFIGEIHVKSEGRQWYVDVGEEIYHVSEIFGEFAL